MINNLLENTTRLGMCCQTHLKLLKTANTPHHEYLRLTLKIHKFHYFRTTTPDYGNKTFITQVIKQGIICKEHNFSRSNCLSIIISRPVHNYRQVCPQLSAGLLTIIDRQIYNELNRKSTGKLFCNTGIFFHICTLKRNIREIN